MSTSFSREAAEFKNDLTRSLGALLGIAQGVLCDGELSDDEIRFLGSWLSENQTLAMSWPGDVVLTKVRAVLSDNVITPEERAHLIETLQLLIGGTRESLAEATHVTEMAVDRSTPVTVPGSSFCFTGDFVFAPRGVCETHTVRHGGVISSSVIKRLNYLVVGSLGSKEWKHGSFGTKVEKAMGYKRQGCSIAVVHEDQWANAISPEV